MSTPTPVAKLRKPRQRWWRFYHRDHDVAFEDSPEGIAYAARKGYKAIDLNVQLNAEGNAKNTHWANPLRHGWIDPLGKLSRDTHVSDMTDAEVARLIYPRKGKPPLRIHSVRSQIKRAAQAGMTRVELDIKGNKRPISEFEAFFARAKTTGDRYGVEAVVKTWRAYRKDPWAHQIITAAHQAGLPTMLIVRGDHLRLSHWAPVLDYLSGGVVWL